MIKIIQLRLRTPCGSFASLAFLCSLIATGCNRVEPAGLPVSGRVLFKGAPLSHGTIEFHPRNNEGTFSGASINPDGTYAISAEHGLMPAEYDVRITSEEGGRKVEDEFPGESEVTAKERIPEDYNVRTKQVVEVKPGAENKFDFDIP